MKKLKKILCAALCAALCAVCVLPVSAAPRPAYGDANADGTVNMKDVLTLRSYLADVYVDIEWLFADANGDNAVNTKDVLLLRKYMAGLPVTFGEFAQPLDLPLCAGKDAAMTLYDVQPDGEYGFELLLGAENLTTDRTVDVVLVGAALNDQTFFPLWDVELEPGEGNVDAAIFGIGEDFDEEIEKVALWTAAMDAKTGEYLDLGAAVTEFYLSGDGSTYEKKDRAPKDGVTLINNSEISAISTGLETDEFGWFTTLNTYMENRTDEPLVYICETAKVDGKDVSALWIAMMLPHTSMETGLLLDVDELSEAAISEIKTVEFSIDAYDITELNKDDPAPLHSYNVTYTAP